MKALLSPACIVGPRIDAQNNSSVVFSLNTVRIMNAPVVSTVARDPLPGACTSQQVFTWDTRTNQLYAGSFSCRRRHHGTPQQDHRGKFCPLYAVKHHI